MMTWQSPPKYREHVYLKCMPRHVCYEKCQKNDVNMAAKGLWDDWDDPLRGHTKVCQCAASA